jgi:tRNA 2-thiouridine synthesizing protein D
VLRSLRNAVGATRLAQRRLPIGVSQSSQQRGSFKGDGYTLIWYNLHNMASFSLLVTHPPFDHQHAYSAYRFALSAIQLGHQVKGVFFYQAGVHNSNSFQAGHSDELNLHQAWVSLSNKHSIPLQVCVTAANRRGIINQQDAKDADREHYNLTVPFCEVGLGDLVELMHGSDRVIQF